jgi:hypothetical protein
MGKNMNRSMYEAIKDMWKLLSECQKETMKKEHPILEEIEEFGTTWLSLCATWSSMLGGYNTASGSHYD